MADTTTATSNARVGDDINETSSIEVTSSSEETSLLGERRGDKKGKEVTGVKGVAEGDEEKEEKDENEGEDEEEEEDVAEKELRARVSLLVESLGPLAAAR